MIWRALAVLAAKVPACPVFRASYHSMAIVLLLAAAGVGTTATRPASKLHAKRERRMICGTCFFLPLNTMSTLELF